MLERFLPGALQPVRAAFLDGQLGRGRSPLLPFPLAFTSVHKSESPVDSRCCDWDRLAVWTLEHPTPVLLASLAITAPREDGSRPELALEAPSPPQSRSQWEPRVGWALAAVCCCLGGCGAALLPLGAGARSGRP